MVRDAVRGYMALASGLTDVTRQRATSAARALVAQGEATAEQVSTIAEDLITTSLTNRAALVSVVRHEIERARTAMGVPTTADMDALDRRVRELEERLFVAERAAVTSASARKAPGSKTPAKQAPAKKAPAKKAPAGMASPSKASTPKGSAAKTAAAPATKRATAGRTPPRTMPAEPSPPAAPATTGAPS